MFYLIAILILIADQLTKWFTQVFLRLGQSTPVLQGIFHITYVQNRGAAFGIQVHQGFLILIAILVIGLVIYFYYHTKERLFTRLALAFVLGGSFSNLLDRLFRGYVVDMFDFRVWPVFNVADMAIDLGVLVLVYEWLKKLKTHPAKGGTKL